jgi:hypothetical protein
VNEEAMIAVLQEGEKVPEIWYMWHLNKRAATAITG